MGSDSYDEDREGSGTYRICNPNDALSSTESEDVAQSQALWDVIHMMRIVKDLAHTGFAIPTTSQL
jgi:hypothetical protein